MALRILHSLLALVLRVFWRPRVEGLAHVPTSGPVIVASNHISFFDSVMLPLVIPRRVVFLAKAEYFEGRGLRGTLVRAWFTAIGAVPVKRGTHGEAMVSLQLALGVLRRGDGFGIYPEGTRSRDGRLHKGHTGVARLALRTGCPIFPVGLQGTLEVQPPDVSLPRPFKVMRVRIGRPIDVTRHRGRVDDRLLLRQITDELMYEIRELSGQEYVDTYATRTSEDLPSETGQIAHAGGNGVGAGAEAPLGSAVYGRPDHDHAA